VLAVPLVLCCVSAFLLALILLGVNHPALVPAALVTLVLGIVLALALTSGTPVHF
jgi:hypothetical protein